MTRTSTSMVAALALGIGMAASPDGVAAKTCTGAHHASAGCAKSTSNKSAAAEPSTKGHKGSKSDRSRKPVDPKAPALDATTLACNQEYEDNKAAIEGGGQSRAKFIKDCRNGTETVPGGIKTGAAVPAVNGPPPGKDLPNADPKSGRPIVDKDDQVTGSTRKR